MAFETRRDSGRPKPPQVGPAVLVLTVLAVAVGFVAYQKGQLTKSDLIFFGVLIPSIILHEISHGWVANLFGDSTAKNAGRLSLNPLRHVDPVGTFLIPAVLIFSQSGLAFGYAKPVPVNTSRMSRDKAMLVGLAGPFTNIVIAILVALIFNTWQPTTTNTAFWIVYELGRANVVLAVFNLIPLPPLDGSAVVERFLPQRHWPTYLKFRQYSMFALMALMFLGPRVLGDVFGPALDFWNGLLPFSVQ